MGEKFFSEGREKQKSRDFEGALKMYLKALEVDSRNAEWLSETGVVLVNLDRKTEALEYLNKAADSEPNNSYRYSSRAYVKAALKDFEGAVLDYQKCIELDPEDSVAYNNLGLVQEQMGYAKKAQKNFKLADDLEDDSKEYLTETKTEDNRVKRSDLDKVKNEENKASILRKVLTEKESFSEFLSFVKNGFKLKK